MSSCTPPAMPLVPLSTGLGVKAPISLAAYVQMSTKLEGRDKLTKILQYGARFFFWYLSRHDPKSPAAARAFKLYRTTQLSRKAFRMLKVLEEILKLQEVCTASRKPATQRLLLALRAAAMGCFWSFDNLNYLTTTQTVNFGNERALKGFSRSWFVGSAAMLVLGVQALAKLSGDRAALEAEWRHLHASSCGSASCACTRCDGASSDAAAAAAGGSSGAGGSCSCLVAPPPALARSIAKANAEQFKQVLGVAKTCLDMLCAANMPGVNLPLLLTGRKLNDGVVGAAGVLSALTVLYNCWPEAPAATGAKKTV